MGVFNNDYSEEPFFFSLDAVLWGVPLLPQHLLWKLFAGLCPMDKGNWQTGTSFPTADSGRPSSAMPTSASCLHCFTTCNQGSSICLSLCCLSARNIWWSWGCSLVRLSCGKADRSWAGQWDSGTKMLSCCQQQMVNVCKKAPLPGILIF